MLRPSQNRLHFKVAASMGVVVSVVMATLAYVNILSQDRNLTENAETASVRLVQSAYSGLEKPMAVGDNDSVEAQLVALGQSLPGVRVHIFDSSERVVFSSRHDRLNKKLTEFIDSPALLQAVTNSLATGQAEPTSYYEKSEGVIKLAVFRPILNAPECHHCHGTSRTVLGGVMVRQVVEEIRGQVAFLRNINIVGAVIGTLAILALLYALLSAMVLDPVRSLSHAAQAVSRGDLTYALPLRRQGKLARLIQAAGRQVGWARRGEDGGLDEIDQLTQGFAEMLARQRATLGAVNELVAGLASLMQQTARVAGTVAAGAGRVDTRVNETLDVVSANIESLHAVASTAERLHASADVSAGAVHQVTMSNQTAADKVAAMTRTAAAAAQTTAAMSASVQQTTRNIEELHDFVDRTSSSIAAMDASFKSVQESANLTFQLSTAVREDAEHHASTVEKTVAGITRIRDASHEGAEVIERLRTHIAEVGTILNVITDVAHQTNLLSLNAAIVAAQAGEHGRGFAVVADEIKALAERTSASTKEIAALVIRIQGLSDQAVASMRENLRSVEIGTGLGVETEVGLKRILDSAQRSATVAKAIAAATVQQGRTSAEVTEAVRRIAKNVEELAGAARAQAQGAEQVESGATRMSELLVAVDTAMAEQTTVSARMLTSSEGVHALARELRDAQHLQTTGSDKVLAAIKAIGDVAREQSAMVDELNHAIARVQRNTDALREQMTRFHM